MKINPISALSHCFNDNFHSSDANDEENEERGGHRFQNSLSVVTRNYCLFLFFPRKKKKKANYTCRSERLTLV